MAKYNKDDLFRPFNKVFEGRNHQSWDSIANILNHYAQIVKGSVLPNTIDAVTAAEEATALLFCVVIATKREHVAGFDSLINSAKGNSFGIRFINWTFIKIGIEVPKNAKGVCDDIVQKMSSTLEEMIHDLEPYATKNGITQEEAIGWIIKRGGIGSLHMAYMSRKKEEKDREKKERDLYAAYGRAQMELNAAKEAGFETAEEHAADQRRKIEEKVREEVKNQFTMIRKYLIKNATLLEGEPNEGQLIIAHEGKFYTLTEEDEYSLLHGVAAKKC